MVILFKSEGRPLQHCLAHTTSKQHHSMDYLASVLDWKLFESLLCLSITCELWGPELNRQMRFSLPFIVITTTANRTLKTETHKRDRNTQITTHKHDELNLNGRLTAVKTRHVIEKPSKGCYRRLQIFKQFLSLSLTAIVFSLIPPTGRTYKPK